MRIFVAICFAVTVAILLAGNAQAETRGSVTNLPIPRYVSLKTTEGNVRRGPSLTHKIDWVFQRRDMPLQVTGEFGHWRRVQDRDGQGGWIHFSLLSGNRTVIIDRDLTPLHVKPDNAAEVNAYAEAGVVAELGSCGPEWCRVSAGGQRGWAHKEALWGVGLEEVRE
jgi:SH3-like domain-containing protein